MSSIRGEKYSERETRTRGNCRYSGVLLEEGKLRAAVEAGLASGEFVELVTALCSELKRLNKMQETVTKPSGVCVTAPTEQDVLV